MPQLMGTPGSTNDCIKISAAQEISRSDQQAAQGILLGRNRFTDALQPVAQALEVGQRLYQPVHQPFGFGGLEPVRSSRSERNRVAQGGLPR